MIYLHGVHDLDGATLMRDKPGWLITTEAIGDDPHDMSGKDFSSWANQGYAVITRLNYSHHGNGTIPVQERYHEFAQRCANFVSASKGCTHWIIGNEPNLPIERPNPQGFPNPILRAPIYPAQYAACYTLCRRNIKSLSYHHDDKVITAPIAPWNVESGDWLQYFQTMLERIYTDLDGIGLHTYSREQTPQSIYSDARMASLPGRYVSFRAFEDFLNRVPVNLRKFPAYITEFNALDAWQDLNNRYFDMVYDYIDDFNDSHTQYNKIVCAAAYRWDKHDQWSMQGKPKLHDDFRAAVANGYRIGDYSLYMPIVIAPPSPSPLPSEIEWDDDLNKRNIVLTPVNLAPGTQGYKITKGEFFGSHEAGGKHHIFVDVVDQNDQRLAGVNIRFFWADGEEIKQTELKPGETYAVDYPMHAAGNAYSCSVLDSPKMSDVVSNMGMGDIQTPQQGDHVSYFFKFQLQNGAVSSTPAAPIVSIREEDSLILPCAGKITQRWGENPDFYSQKLGIPYHNGLDIAAAPGTAVVAPADGKVVFVGSDPNYGNYVRIYHDALGIHTFMAHLDSYTVNSNQRVRLGQVIGAVGSTGLSTGPHVHFEVRIGEENAYHPGTFGHNNGRIDPETALYFINQFSTEYDILTDTLTNAAIEFGVSPALILAMAQAESGFRPNAISPAGAKGILQIMPVTWNEWSVKVNASDILDPRDNARVGAAYLQWLLSQNIKGKIGDEYYALVAYNFGIGNLLDDVAIPEATDSYARKIVFAANLLRHMGLS